MFAKKVEPPMNVIPLQPQPMQRTTAGLREFMFNELEAFIRGSTTPERLRAITNTSYAILDSARLELEFARYAKTKNAKGRQASVKPVRLVKKTARARND